MGNEQAAPLPGESAAPETINNLRRTTPFTYKEADQILRRYSTMDPSAGGKTGMTIDECMMMPEFTGNVFAPDIIRSCKDKDTKKIHQRHFMKICTVFCRRTAALKKKQFLFDMFDVDKQKMLSHDGMYRIFKLMLSNAVSDDHILALVFSALRHPSLTRDDEVTREEFADMIPDNEIQEKMSIDFAFDPSTLHQPEPEEEEDDDEDDDEDDEEEEEEAPDDGK